MTSENTQQRAAWEVAFGQQPRKGSRAMPQSLDFSLQNPIAVNLVFEQQSERLEFVQALYVDNSSNGNALVATFRGTNQIITVPGGWQGYIPVLATSDNCHISFATTGTPIVPVNYLSFPVPLALWPANGSNFGGSSGIDHSANRPAFPPAGLNLIATAPVNASRNSIEVQNQSAVTIIVVRDDGNGNNISYIYIAPGIGVGTQGGDWSSYTFKGRIRVYSTNLTDQVGMFED